jgi:hypothetical protein
MNIYLSFENKINHCEILEFGNNFSDKEFEIENQLYLLKIYNIYSRQKYIQMLPSSSKNHQLYKNKK